MKKTVSILLAALTIFAFSACDTPDTGSPSSEAVSSAADYHPSDPDTIALTEEEMARRKSEFSWRFNADDYPRFLRLFVKNVGSMAKGGIWE